MSAVLETFATLQVFAESLSPVEITRVLGVAASSEFPQDPDSRNRSRRSTNLWSISTERVVQSLDSDIHVRFLADLLDGKAATLAELRSKGAQTRIVGYVVTTGQGGPELSAETMGALSRLGLGIWWDVYVGKASDYDHGT